MLLSSSYDKSDTVKIVKKRRNKISPEECKNLLYSHLVLEEKLLKCLYENNTTVDDFKKSLSKLKHLRKESYNALNLEHEDTNDLGNLIFIKERDIHPELLESYNTLKSHIEILLNMLSSNDIPAINLSSIIDFVNNFTKYLLKENNEIKQTNFDQNILLIENQKIPLSLKSGRKILLNNRCFDLSKFSYNELIEILRVLDIVTKEDEFDYLRAKITEELSNLISFIKD